MGHPCTPVRSFPSDQLGQLKDDVDQGGVIGGLAVALGGFEANLLRSLGCGLVEAVPQTPGAWRFAQVISLIANGEKGDAAKDLVKGLVLAAALALTFSLRRDRA